MLYTNRECLVRQRPTGATRPGARRASTDPSASAATIEGGTDRRRILLRHEHRDRYALPRRGSKTGSAPPRRGVPSYRWRKLACFATRCYRSDIRTFALMFVTAAVATLAAASPAAARHR